MNPPRSKDWMDTFTPRPGASMQIARELDIPDVPAKFDLASDIPTQGPLSRSLPRPLQDAEMPSKPRRNLFLEAYDRIIKRHEERVEEARLDESSTLASVRRWVLRLVAVFASLSCAATSTYFSNRWFVASQPKVIAIVMSLTVVATLTVSPELSISLARKRRYLTAIIIAAISVLATVFSMGSTIGGIYNATTARVEMDARDSESRIVSNSEELAATTQIQLLQARIERLSKSMATDQGAVASYQGAIDKALADGADPISREVSTLVANRTGALSRIRTGELAISKAEDEIRSLSATAARGVVGDGIVEKAARLDFNLWLGQRFGMSQDQMEFMLAAFPAIFIDLIAPAMLVVAFSL